MDLPAHVYIYHIQKDRLAPGEFGDVHSKQLPAFGHVFQLTNLVAANPEGVVATIDRMKKQEELLVGSFLNLQGSTATVRFSDSKADDLLQAADIWAGFMRTGLETYFANPRTHTPCQACLHKFQPLCRYKRRHELHPTVQQITPLFRKLADNGQTAYLTGLVSNPVRFDLYMIDCLGFHRGKWTKNSNRQGGAFPPRPAEADKPCPLCGSVPAVETATRILVACYIVPHAAPPHPAA